MTLADVIATLDESQLEKLMRRDDESSDADERPDKIREIVEEAAKKKKILANFGRVYAEKEREFDSFEDALDRLSGVAKEKDLRFRGDKVYEKSRHCWNPTKTTAEFVYDESDETAYYLFVSEEDQFARMVYAIENDDGGKRFPRIGNERPQVRDRHLIAFRDGVYDDKKGTFTIYGKKCERDFDPIPWIED